MELTPQQEAQLVDQYKRLIWEIIHRNLREKPPLITYEDCFQDCVIVFLQYARKMDSVDDLEHHFPFYQIKTAIQKHIFAGQPLKWSTHTGGFRKMLKREAETQYVDFEGLFQQPSGKDVAENSDFSIDFRHFMERQSGLEQKIVAKKLSGLRNRDIARELGLTDIQVTRILQRLLRQFKAEDNS